MVGEVVVNSVLDHVLPHEQLHVSGTISQAIDRLPNQPVVTTCLSCHARPGLGSSCIDKQRCVAARHEALELLGCSPDEFARDGTPLALSELSIQYKAPLRSQDKFYVAMYVSKVTAARVVVQHTIVKTAARRQELEQPQVRSMCMIYELHTSAPVLHVQLMVYGSIHCVTVDSTTIQ
jgi:acyl-CoA thioesterase FadM